MLMIASLGGDSRSYTSLLTELEAILRAYFRRRLHSGLEDRLDDLVQDVLLAIHQRRITYEPTRPLTAWVHAIARYKLIDLLRRERGTRQVPINDYAELLADGRDDAGVRADAVDLDAILTDLPERTRWLVRQVKIEGVPVVDVAARSGMTPSAVKVAVHRAMQMLIARTGRRS